MSNTQNSPEQTYEQSAQMWSDLSGWSASFASGVVEAFETGGTSAAERLTAVRAQYQVAIASAIVRRDAALAAADVIAEAVWRQAADEMARTAFALAAESRLAAERLATFQVSVNSGLLRVGAAAGAAFDVFAVKSVKSGSDSNIAVIRSCLLPPSDRRHKWGRCQVRRNEAGFKLSDCLMPGATCRHFREGNGLAGPQPSSVSSSSVSISI